MGQREPNKLFESGSQTHNDTMTLELFYILFKKPIATQKAIMHDVVHEYFDYALFTTCSQFKSEPGVDMLQIVHIAVVHNA